jgi:hypothetical protein
MKPSNLVISLYANVKYLFSVTGVFLYSLMAINSPKSQAKIKSGFSMVSIKQDMQSFVSG